MIDREYQEYFLVCDICGEEVNGFEDFEDALDYKENEGWESKPGEQLDLKYGWVDVCPKCQK